eukprot:Pgem_evm1s13619
MIFESSKLENEEKIFLNLEQKSRLDEIITPELKTLHGIFLKNDYQIRLVG